MDELSITELDDKEGVVYVLGIAHKAPESVRKWFYGDEFRNAFLKRFDHAEMLRVPGAVGTVEVTETSKQELEELLDL